MDAKQLPIASTCGDCRHFVECQWEIGDLTGRETTCSFSPSRFAVVPDILPAPTGTGGI